MNQPRARTGQVLPFRRRRQDEAPAVVAVVLVAVLSLACGLALGPMVWFGMAPVLCAGVAR